MYPLTKVESKGSESVAQPEAQGNADRPILAFIVANHIDIRSI
jgi:hypothetical protein